VLVVWRVFDDPARRLFDALLAAADRETLLLLNPVLARLVGSVRAEPLMGETVRCTATVHRRSSAARDAASRDPGSRRGKLSLPPFDPIRYGSPAMSWIEV
jgi:hypothetical protein